MNRYFLIIITACFYSSNLYASSSDNKYNWLPITDADRNLRADSSLGRDAIMIFEKIITDDRDLENKEYYFDVYNRIKIFTPEGKNWAEVSIPYDEDEDIEEIHARSIQPDGREIELNPESIHESEFVKTDETIILQKSFSIPGVSDGSIIEYHYKIQKKGPTHTWVFQKVIPLLHGEFQWYFFTEPSHGLSWLLALIGFQPNYLWMNCEKKEGKTEIGPSKDEPEYAIFTVDSVIAFNREPYTLAENTIKKQVQCYYGSTTPAEKFWAEVSENTQNYLVDYFLKDKDPLKEIVEKFSGSTNERILSAFNWLRTHIQNTASIHTRKKLNKNTNVEDLLDNGYGTNTEINLAFNGMLDAMGIKSQIVFAADHRDRRFIPQAKFWQFDCSIVAINLPNKRTIYCNPGDVSIPFGYVPWYIEGTGGLFVGNTVNAIQVIPAAPMDSSFIRRSLKLKIADDLSITGTLTEVQKGHSTESLRKKFYNQTTDSRSSILEDYIKKSYPNIIIDSIQKSEINDSTSLINIESNIRFTPLQRTSKNSLQIRPLNYLARHENPFQQTERIHTISMEYAELVREQVSLELPKGWTTISSPPPIYISNDIGRIVVFTEISDSTLTIIRSFYTTLAFWPETQYALVRNLFQRYDESTDLLWIIGPK